MNKELKVKFICYLLNLMVGIVNLLKVAIYFIETYIKTIVAFIIFIAFVWFFYPQIGNDLFKELQLTSIYYKMNFISVFFMIYIVLTIYIKGRLPIIYLSFYSVINYEGEYMIVKKNMLKPMGEAKEIKK